MQHGNGNAATQNIIYSIARRKYLFTDSTDGNDLHTLSEAVFHYSAVSNINVRSISSLNEMGRIISSVQVRQSVN